METSELVTKVCGRCGESKPLADFSLNASSPDGRQYRCKPCANALALLDYQQNKERYYAKARKRDEDLDALINAYKDRPCMDCGVKYPPYVMDLDHRDPSTKVQKLSTMRRRRMAFWKIVAEMEKCDVVCANCHRERTNRQRPARYSTAAVAAPCGDF